MSDRVPRAVRWVLAVAAPLVPAHRRDAWSRQWIAEVKHRRATGAGAGVLRFVLGSVSHAYYLRRQEWSMRGWISDLAHAARALSRRPGFSALTVATLSIGIGAATAIFSLAETLLLRPLPLEESDRLVRIYSSNPTRGMGTFSVSYHDYRDFTSRSDLFESASFYGEDSRDISGGGEPERVRVIPVHTDFFQTLRSPAALGRLFVSDDSDPAGERTAVLSEAFWTRRFGADPAVVGRAVRIDGVPHTVVGVVDERLAWPAGAQIWIPLQWGGSVPEYADSRSNHTWQVIARLAPAVRVADADAQLHSMAEQIYGGPDVLERDRGTSAVVLPLHSSEGGEDAAQLFLLLGSAVFLVLLIACMNASGLLMTRAWSRARELSLRAALGAARVRLVGMLLGESAVLALAGGVIGVGLGHLALQRMFALAPPEITNIGDVRLNLPVVVAGVAISLFAALIAGLVPAVRASKLSVADSLRDGSGQAGQGSRATRLRRTLVVAELALSLALLVGAGLTIRGFQRQIVSDPGFDAETLLSFTVRLPSSRYEDRTMVEAYYADAVERLESHPGITSATGTSRLPLDAGGMSLYRAFIFDGATPPPEGAEFGASWVEIDPGYFETVGVAPIEGRAFTADDRGEAPLVAIVNERMARQMSPDGPIVGRVIRSFYDENLPRTVVGVIPDLQFNGVSRAQRQPLVMVPSAQSARTSMAFLVRTAGDPRELIPAVRTLMAEVDGDVALDALQPLRDAHAADLAGIRFLTTLFGTFGALALVLAVSGVYGLVSYSVSQRTQEIGVRMAIGATAGSVRGAVLGESALLATVGLTIGLGLAYVGGRVLAVGMDGIAVVEPSTYAGVTLLLAASVLMASWWPATRATRVDPVEALRSE